MTFGSAHDYIMCLYKPVKLFSIERCLVLKGCLSFRTVAYNSSGHTQPDVAYYLGKITGTSP